MDKILTLPAISVEDKYPLPHSDFRAEFKDAENAAALNESEKNYGGNIIVMIKNKKNYYPIGLLAKIIMKIKIPNGSYKIRLKILSRVNVITHYNAINYLIAEYEPIMEYTPNADEEKSLVKILKKEIGTKDNNRLENYDTVYPLLDNYLSLGYLTDILAYNLTISESKKEKYLLEVDPLKRAVYVIEDLKFLTYTVKLEQKINEDVRKNIEESQKEYYLREKMRAIQNELGDKGRREDEIDKLREGLKKAKLPKDIYEKALFELKRYEAMPQANAESNIIKSYLDFIIDLPWYKQSKDNDDLNKTIEILDRNHYGLEKVKQRIIEYLGVKIMTKKNPQTILCLVGPPGVGKTTLAISIAEALGRKFVRQSLGGMKDEAEIKGHRRTYVGAMPGRILAGMKNAKTMNPVFLLDEIDKMASSYKGDPASAMLEVLDPEQNKNFSDYYLEEPYDLSQVMFITTANYLGNIPEPLKDRMEIIEVSSYTEQEKFNIAISHLIPKQLESHGMSKEKFNITDEAIYDLIRFYTREAGVRELNRVVGSVIRKSIMLLLTKKLDTINVEKDNLHELLGKPIYSHNNMLNEDQIGIVTGLAYTSFGGDTLSIEVTYFKGTGKLVLTGKLGDVMKESAMAALSYVRANSEKFNIDSKVFAENDIHIHVPEGAIPKDGPSAGVTITTAIVSALTSKYVNKDLGMTGEITLRGNVLPIGGLKEKAIAAHRSGLKKILIPKSNVKDIEDVPKEVLEKLEIIPVDNIDEVLKQALK